MKSMMGNQPQKPEGADDYEEDVKGLPVRRRRNAKLSNIDKLLDESNELKADSKFIHLESEVVYGISQNVARDLSTVLNTVKDFIVTTMPDNLISSNDPKLDNEASTGGKLLVKIMKSTII